MTVRITTAPVGKPSTVVVEGRLTAAEVPSLREACRSVGNGVRLDLTGLRMADDAGIGQLRLLAEEGAELYGASLLIRQMLNGE